MKAQAADIFEQLHTGLAVSLISTPKSAFVTCRLDEQLSSVVGRNTEKFDHMPVVDATRGAIVGVAHLSSYYASPAPRGTIADHFVPLNEGHLIGADASILSFLKTADHRPFRLVVSADGVLGLVSLSDIQALPVRACLFSLVTGLEITMSDVISRVFKAPAEWKLHLSEGRRQKLDDEIRQAIKSGGIVSELLFTQFADKITILDKSILKSLPEREKTARQLKAVERLRNRLAHANDYAPDSATAANVCATVRDILRLRTMLDAAGY